MAMSTWEQDILKSLAVDKPIPDQVPLEASVPMAMCGVPLKGLWSKGKSVLENIHLGASVVVHEDMLEHIRECGYR